MRAAMRSASALKSSAPYYSAAWYGEACALVAQIALKSSAPIGRCCMILPMLRELRQMLKSSAL
jgi:hypothetical protein